MGYPKQAVLFLEEDSSLMQNELPLALRPFLNEPVLKWIYGALKRASVERFFVCAGPNFAEAVRTLLPGEGVTVSEQQSDLFDFLDASDEVLVFPRAVLPLQEAGVGLVYKASAFELKDCWKNKMSNQISGAVLVPGFLPVYSNETLKELEPAYEARGLKP